MNWDETDKKIKANKAIRKLETKLKTRSKTGTTDNEALHKTSAFLADEARRTERAMERGRYRR